MVHLVTGFAGENHITSADDGALNRAIIGESDYVLETGGYGYFAAQIIDNNTVRINSGEGVMNGRHFRIDYGTFEDVKIDNGQAGMQRYDIIVVTYEKDTTTGIESAYLEVIKGTPKASHPSWPTYENGNIYTGATKSRFPLYNVFIDGVELKSVTKRFYIQESLHSIMKVIGDADIDEIGYDVKDAIRNLNSNLSLSYINVTSDCTDDVFNIGANIQIRHALRVTNHIAHVSGIITLNKDVAKWTTLLSFSIPPKNYEQVILWNYYASSPIYGQLQTNGDLQTNVDLSSGTILRFGFWYIYD